MSGLSKSSGLPQLKLGWIIAEGPGHQAALDHCARCSHKITKARLGICFERTELPHDLFTPSDMR
jgi:hypothetical protein